MYAVCSEVNLEYRNERKTAMPRSKCSKSKSARKESSSIQRVVILTNTDGSQH